MKNLSNLLLVAGVIITALKPKLKAGDRAKAKNKVDELMDKCMDAWNAKDAGTFTSYLADGGQFYGSDPSETWDKETFSALIIPLFADPSKHYGFTLLHREVLVSTQGNSALVLEQFTMKEIIPNIIWRSVTHVAKTGDHWLIDFMCRGFIFKNEDVEKVSKALE